MAVRKDTKILLEWAREQGFETVLHRGHWKFYLDGRMTGTVGSTSSEYRALANCRADLRRALKAREAGQCPTP